MRPALSVDPPLSAIPAVLAAEGVDAFQTVLRDPGRFGNHGVPDEADRAGLLAGLQARPAWGVAHGSLLVNLASPEGRIRNSSVSSVVADLRLAAELGLAGVCFHVGYARGHPSQEAALAMAARKLAELVERAPAGPRVLLENSCEGSELGQTVEELAWLLREVGAPPERLGLLVDTCHLHAAGFDLSGPEAGARLADALAGSGVLDRVAALHFNDCQLPCGAHRDRHAAPGEGTIGAGLLAVAAHPAFAGLPAILELDLDAARRGLAYLRAHGLA
jgi:deoxyribonuclease-4